jgi:formate dehydrogenase iron-sulfur subunit
VACKEWNDLEVDATANFGGYQSHEDLTPNTWDLMRFNEVDIDGGGIAWLIRKDSCLHCGDPGCLKACPAPGAIVQYENGIVDFDQTKCIGCQYCVSGCPFDIPRFDPQTKKVYKCTLCVDRVSNGMTPACVKSCPTGAIRFGTKEQMVAYGEEKVAKLHERGFNDAVVYDPESVGGLHMTYVVPRGEMLEEYGLPSEPTVQAGFFPVMDGLRKLGSIATWAGIAATAIFFLRTGRRLPPSEREAVAAAHANGSGSGAGHATGEPTAEGQGSDSRGGER